ncbi:MAG: hypothetical protein PHO70_06400 [Candidatus Omnitrophica bacterium]|nr:hypothetical protein [Candidatus Omnitrophota bacterium]
MKALANIFVAIGLVLTIIAIAGRISGQPGIIKGYKVMSILLVANTCFLIALVSKVFSSCKK